MLRQRGYPGSAVQVRRAVRRLRPAPPSAAYLRLATLPGEVAQVDWGSFGAIRIGRGTRPLSAFVYVLGYSRAIHAVFTLDQTLESFLRGHVDAFAALGGCARVLMYDNLKSAVLDRQGTRPSSPPRPTCCSISTARRPRAASTAACATTPARSSCASMRSATWRTTPTPPTSSSRS